MSHLVRRLAEDKPLPERVRLVARQLVGGKQQFGVIAASLCEGASLLARRLRMPDEVARTLGLLMSRWDGNGVPAAVAGEGISRPLRIVRVAHDLVALAEDAIHRRRSRRCGGAAVAAMTPRSSMPRSSSLVPYCVRRPPTMPGAGDRGGARAGGDDLEDDPSIGKSSSRASAASRPWPTDRQERS